MAAVDRMRKNSGGVLCYSWRDVWV